jgi:hypothetical protein
MDSFILKNLWQAKHEKYNEQEDNGYYLVQHYWYGHSQEKKDQVPMEASWPSQQDKYQHSYST